MATKKKAAASQTAYQSIREQILHLEITPGSSISEIETAAKYNISRTPVRAGAADRDGGAVFFIRRADAL